MKELLEHAHLAGKTAVRLGRLLPTHTKEDLEQAALEGVWLGLQTWDGRVQLRTWLIRRARWAIYAYVESTKPAGLGKRLNSMTCHLSALHDEDTQACERALADYSHERYRQQEEAREEMETLLALVPLEWRELLRRYYLQGDNMATIARDMGCSQQAVSLRLAKAWRRLRSQARQRYPLGYGRTG